MSLDLVLRPEAEAEMAEAFAWYEGRLPGLGADFLVAADAVFRNIQRNPLQYPEIHRGVRRALLRRFPYQVLFIVGDRCVAVLAVFHAKRNPRRWQERT